MWWGYDVKDTKNKQKESLKKMVTAVQYIIILTNYNCNIPVPNKVRV